MRALRNAAVAALLACVSVPAFAQDTVKWGEVSGWEVYVDRTLGNGCFTALVYEDGTVFRIGFNHLEGGFGYLMIGNANWKSLEVGKEYAMQFIFGNAVPWDATATAFDMNGSTALVAKFDTADLALEFMKKQSVKLRYENKEISHLSLRGSFAAFSEVLNCQEAMNARPSQNLPAADDPFSGRSTPASDPFAM